MADSGVEGPTTSASDMDAFDLEESQEGSDLFSGNVNSGSVDEPDFLPPFANEENRKLDTEIKKTEKDLEEFSESLEENVERINAMTEHLKNVEQEVLYTQVRRQDATHL